MVFDKPKADGIKLNVFRAGVQISSIVGVVIFAVVALVLVVKKAV